MRSVSVHRMRIALFAAVSVALMGGCDNLDVKEPEPFRVLIRVEGDPNRPLEGIPIHYQEREISRTKPDGSAVLELNKPDGTFIELRVGCPEGTRQADPLKVYVRRVEGQVFTEQRMACKPLIRKVAVAIRADDGPNLPVLYLGQPRARTDESGAALFTLDLPVGETFQVMLDTSGDPMIHPQRPTVVFAVAEEDDMKVFSQSFTRDKPKKTYVRRPVGPQPLR